mmetsp:Transcript_23514/g.32906  ORF Transcript_23514/g.32906 Transcript_23514/m.32906 type:complete len:100 (+) Transcript_23514:84-383(+)
MDATMNTPQHASTKSVLVNPKACCADDAGKITPLKGGAESIEEVLTNDGCLKCLLVSMCPCCLCTLGASCFAPHCYLYCCYGKELMEEFKAQAAAQSMK